MVIHDYKIQVLIDHGADVNARVMRLDSDGQPVGPNDVGFTPLMIAAIHNNTEVVRTLIEAGASLDLQDGEGRTALHHAVVHAWIEVF